MQRMFIWRFVAIMAITVGLALLFNFILQTGLSERNAEQSAKALMSEIELRLADNQAVIDSLVVDLNENYITRARAFAEIIAKDPAIVESVEEMQRIAELLNVEEVHVTDENGLLLWGNLSKYFGLNFADTDQTRPFMPALTDKSFVLAQEPRPNGSFGMLFQYIGVARQDKPGIVQVGIAPERLEKALANNKIDVAIANFNVNEGICVTAFDETTGLVVGDTKGTLLGEHYSAIGVKGAYITGEKMSGWMDVNGVPMFCVFGWAGDYRLRVSYTKPVLFAERESQSLAAALTSVFLGLTIVASIFILLKRKIITDVEGVNRALKRITNGDLTVAVTAEATPEFAALSGGINEMVDSLKVQMEEIASQADTLRLQAVELEESNENIRASLQYARKIQNNLLPSPKPFTDTFSDYCVLWEPRDEVGGDIYWMKRFEAGAVLCVCDCTGHGTPGALLTMLVVSALDAIVCEDNCEDPPEIMWRLEQKLVDTLNVFPEEDRSAADIKDGADLCILFIAREGAITLSSAKLHVFIADGHRVESIRGQRLAIGDGSLKSKDQIKAVTIPYEKGNSMYIVSDGLFEQVGGAGSVPFGYSRFKALVLENYGKTQEEITGAVWAAFEAYMGGESRRDDVTLVSFKL